ncbi:MAG TPA: helicase HerA-like domain-containing protein [Bacteroidia bacterium]|nr:helicase HerA-like domain-containing protein [Bacteroidia bacterium]
MKADFVNAINNAYSSKGLTITLGAPMLNGEVCAGAPIKLPLSTFNRHGLIAGATGTGKTKTLQGMAEALSRQGVPSLLMDIKGDLSGLAMAGTPNPKIAERQSKIGIEWQPEGFPVELYSISNEQGTRMRATLIEFGPVLFSRILELNDIQSGVVAMVFKYCDDAGMPLLDLKDFRKTLQYLTNEGKAEVEEKYGAISKTTTSTIIRKILEIEQQGAEMFFGERSFEVNDLLRSDPRGRGYINIVRLTDIQDRPKLFSTFMLCLLDEIYATFPESGDLEKPRLVIFIDEAHLVFEEASKSLLNQIEMVIKLIRSKGVGVFFCTQQPTDVPADILSQLGLKVQHALRAFTANDRKNIKSVAENYPLSDFYKTEDLLTALGIGEALVTGLNEKGIPTPLAQVMLCAPRSRMDVLSEKEMESLVNDSPLAKKYNEEIDRESAFEILTQKLKGITPASELKNQKPEREQHEKTILEEVAGSALGRQVMRSFTQEVTRSLLGVLGIGYTRKRR